MGVNVGVSVGDGVWVGRGVDVSVSVGAKVSVKGMLVDVAAGFGESEAGVPPGLSRLHADVIHINVRMSRCFVIFMG